MATLQESIDSEGDETTAPLLGSLQPAPAPTAPAPAPSYPIGYVEGAPRTMLEGHRLPTGFQWGNALNMGARQRGYYGGTFTDITRYPMPEGATVLGVREDGTPKAYVYNNVMYVDSSRATSGGDWLDDIADQVNPVIDDIFQSGVVQEVADPFGAVSGLNEQWHEDLDPLVPEGALGGYVDRTLTGLAGGLTGSPLGIQNLDYQEGGATNVQQGGVQHAINAALGYAALAGGGAGAGGITTTPLEPIAVGTPVEIGTGEILAGGALGGGVAEAAGDVAAAGAGEQAVEGLAESQNDWEAGTGNVGTYTPETTTGEILSGDFSSMEAIQERIGQALSTMGVSWEQFLSNPGAYVGDLIQNGVTELGGLFDGGGGSSGGGGGTTINVGGGGGLDWLPAILGMASALSADYSAKDTLPEWIKPYTMDVLNRSKAEADRPFTPYTGQAIAPMSGNERLAYDIAQRRGSMYDMPGFDYLGQARQYADRGALPFTQADMQAYMNPYIMNALDPAAREMSKAYQLEQMRNRDLQISRGAFGGDRGALLEAETTGNYLTGVGDLYKTGLADAWQRGTQLWQGDRDAAARASGQFGSLAGIDTNIRNADLTALRDTGGLSRSLEQAQDTFDYQQFLEGRDWSSNQLDDYADRVASTQTGTEIQPADRTGAILGALSAGIGMMTP